MGASPPPPPPAIPPAGGGAGEPIDAARVERALAALVAALDRMRAAGLGPPLDLPGTNVQAGDLSFKDALINRALAQLFPGGPTAVVQPPGQPPPAGSPFPTSATGQPPPAGSPFPTSALPGQPGPAGTAPPVVARPILTTAGRAGFFKKARRFVGGLGRGVLRKMGQTRTGQAAKKAGSSIAGIFTAKTPGAAGGAFVAATAAVWEFGKAVVEGAKAQRDYNFRLAEFSGAMAAVKVEADVRELVRDMEKGNRLAASARMLSGSEQDMKDELKEFEVLAGNLKNLVYSVGLEAITQAIRPFVQLVAPLNEAISKFLGSGEIKGDIWESVQRAREVANEAKKRSDEWLNRHGGFDRRNQLP